MLPKTATQERKESETVFSCAPTKYVAADIRVEWLSDSVLQVRYVQGVEIYRQRSSAYGVRVQYVVEARPQSRKRLSPSTGT